MVIFFSPNFLIFPSPKILVTHFASPGVPSDTPVLWGMRVYLRCVIFVRAVGDEDEEDVRGWS